METRKANGLEYSGITLGAVLIMAFVLVQPTMQAAYAVSAEDNPAFDQCDEDHAQPEDPISMNTVRSGKIVKTIHAEKMIFDCFLDQGNIPVIVDVTTYIEIYENIDDREVVETNAFATTCIKDEFTGTVIDCESYDIPSTPVPVGSNCEEEDDESGLITHPQEMNTVNKGNIAKTIETQKETFDCELGEEEEETEKQVDIVLFTEIYENLSTQEVLEVQFYAMRCVMLLSDETLASDGGFRDGVVETCQFSTIEN
jgi:hypothetical protein